MDFLRESALCLRECMKHAARESVQRSMMFTSFCIRIKRLPKRHYYLFSFNLNLYLLTLALENLYFNTLDREKVQGKSLGCIKSRGGTPPLRIVHPRYREPPQRRGLPTPGLAYFTLLAIATLQSHSTFPVLVSSSSSSLKVSAHCVRNFCMHFS